MFFKAAFLAILLIPALAVSYYFVVVLPSNERAKLQLEKDKYEAEKKERAEREEQKKDNDILFGSCTVDADSAYWSYVKLNGKPVPGKAGTYSAPMHIWDAAEKRKSNALAECHKEFDK
jgi:hypothetical protein